MDNKDGKSRATLAVAIILSFCWFNALLSFNSILAADTEDNQEVEEQTVEQVEVKEPEVIVSVYNLIDADNNILESFEVIRQYRAYQTGIITYTCADGVKVYTTDTGVDIERDNKLFEHFVNVKFVLKGE